MTRQFTTLKEEQAEKAIRARWTHDAALRSEFVDDRDSCIAFHKAEARGATKNHGGGNVVSGRPAPAAAASSPSASMEYAGAPTMSRSNLQVNTFDKALEERARQNWERNPGLNGHSNFQSYRQACIQQHLRGSNVGENIHG